MSGWGCVPAGGREGSTHLGKLLCVGHTQHAELLCMCHLQGRNGMLMLVAHCTQLRSMGVVCRCCAFACSFAGLLALVCKRA